MLLDLWLHLCTFPELPESSRPWILLLDGAECCNISHRLLKTGGSQSPLGVAYATAILVDQGLQLEEASKGRDGTDGSPGPQERAACCHHLQSVILTNQGAADDDDHPEFDQPGGRQAATDFPVIISCIISNHSSLPAPTR